MRESNIELLRIIAIIGVFILHLYNPNIGGGINYCNSFSNELLLRLIESLFVCSVDLFVLISGFFLSQKDSRDWLKPISLIIQLIVFKVVIYGGLVLLGRLDFSLYELILRFIPQNWFVVLYVVLYVCSPYLNIIINKLNRNQYNRFLLIIFILFSVYPICVDMLAQWTNKSYDGLSSIGMYGSQYGYTIVQFVLMYFIGGYLAKYKIKIQRKKMLYCFVICIIALTLWSFIDKFTGYLVEPNAWEYCNPLVIIEAIILFCIFQSFCFKSLLINCLSKSCFTMYLLHGLAYRIMDIEYIVNTHPVFMLLYIVLCGVCTYIVCYIIHMMYRIVTQPIFKYLHKKWPSHIFYI